MTTATHEQFSQDFDSNLSTPESGPVEDVATRARRFFEVAATRAGRRDLRGLSPEALSTLISAFADDASLEHAIERAISYAAGPYVTRGDLPEDLRTSDNVSGLLAFSLPPRGLDLRATVEDLETRMILQALERTGWNKNRASRLLGLNRTTLVEMIKRKRLVPPPGLRKTPASSAPQCPEAFEDEAIAAE